MFRSLIDLRASSIVATMVQPAHCTRRRVCIRCTFGWDLISSASCSCTVGALSGHPHDTSPCDSKNNTFKCLRTLDVGGDGGALSNSAYCEYDDPEAFVELYDLDADPYNLRNIAGETPAATLAKLKARLHAFMLCSGSDCFDPPPAAATPSARPARSR